MFARLVNRLEFFLSRGSIGFHLLQGSLYFAPAPSCELLANSAKTRIVGITWPLSTPASALLKLVLKGLLASRYNIQLNKTSRNAARLALAPASRAKNASPAVVWLLPVLWLSCVAVGSLASKDWSPMFRSPLSNQPD